LSTSADKTKRTKALKTVLIYFVVSLFCVFFGLEYERFSHGVYSNYMIYMFLFPLLGGAAPFGVLWLIKKLSFPGRVSFNLYNAGIAALTVGSCMQGVLQIYGTSSDLTLVYWITGIFLTACGAAFYIFSKSTRNDK
jgi:hypothetical protein